MKRFKKFLAILLVASMIFTTNAVSVFAEGVDAGKEEQFNDDMAESTEELSESLELDKEEESAEVSEDEELGEEELTEAEADDEFVEEEEEKEAKAEEEELSETGEETEEINEEKLEANKKKDVDLYGATYMDSASVTKYTITDYDKGDCYDPTDLEVTPTYKEQGTPGLGDSVDPVPYVNNESRFRFVPDYVNQPFETRGEVSMTIYYSDGNNEVSAGTQSLRIGAVNNIIIKTYPKTKYRVGDNFDPTGLGITVQWKNGETDDFDYDANTFRAIGDTENLQESTTKVYVEVEGVPRRVEIPITVSNNPVVGISVKTPPTKTTYYSHTYFKPDGLEISVENDDESTDTISYAGHESDFSFSIDLDQELTTSTTTIQVTYAGESADISITVNQAEKIDTFKHIYVVLGKSSQTKILPTGIINGTEKTYNEFIEQSLITDDRYVPKGKELAGFCKIDITGFIVKPEILDAYNAGLGTGIYDMDTIFDEWDKDSIIACGVVLKDSPNSGGGQNPSGGSSSSSGSSSGGGGSSDPTHGPMGDLTKNPLYANALRNIAVNTTNNIPQSSLVNNSGLYVQLKSMQENANTSFNNAKDSFGNVGYGQWLRVPNSTTWYFYSGDLNQATNGQTQGFLSNGWFNLGWDGQDRWYHFDGSGVMQLGWYQEAGKTYFLQNDINDNWYGKAVTGTQNIGGRIYNFDATGALIS